MAALAWWSVTNEQRAAFGTALQEALALRGVSQGSLAAHMGTRQSVISSWCYGKFAASPAAIFAVEEFLELPPAWLSQHFGFGPLNPPVDVTSEQALLQDTRLTDDDRKMLLSILKKTVEFNELTAAKSARPRASRKASKAAEAAVELAKTSVAKKAPAKAVAKKAAGSKTVAKKAAPARRLSRASGDGR